MKGIMPGMNPRAYRMKGNGSDSLAVVVPRSQRRDLGHPDFFFVIVKRGYRPQDDNSRAGAIKGNDYAGFVCPTHSRKGVEWMGHPHWMGLVVVDFYAAVGCLYFDGGAALAYLRVQVIFDGALDGYGEGYGDASVGGWRR